MAPQRPQIQFQPPSPGSFPVQAVVMQQPLISSLAPAARLPISNSLLSGPPTGTKKAHIGGGMVVQDMFFFPLSPIHCLPPTPHDETGDPSLPCPPACRASVGACPGRERERERERAGAGWTDRHDGGRTCQIPMRLMSGATVSPLLPPGPRERAARDLGGKKESMKKKKKKRRELRFRVDAARLHWPLARP